MRSVAGFEATNRAKSEMRKLAKSVRRCAASVMIARLLAKRPPEKTKHDQSRIVLEIQKKTAQLETCGAPCLRNRQTENCESKCGFLDYRVLIIKKSMI